MSPSLSRREKTPRSRHYSMSHTHAVAASSSNQASKFQLIFHNALKAYEKRTKKDLLAHPLAAQLQNCDSPSSILLVLQQQVQELNRSQRNHDRLTKWLDPTVNVLCTFSATVGEGVSLVRLRPSTREMCTHSAFDRSCHQQKLSLLVSGCSF
jgi:hypothetical protein